MKNGYCTPDFIIYLGKCTGQSSRKTATENIKDLTSHTKKSTKRQQRVAV